MLRAAGSLAHGTVMFEKLLIANRGEIACRIIRTCRRLGIRTVAVHSDPDADALHVQEADEAVALGGSTAAESYLVIDKLLDACRRTGAQAVHPGYGFLSERAAFARALEAEGIVFVGPPVGAIAAMGDKIESKRLAREAGVSTVPGTLDAIADPALAVRIAREIGYPVMVKASAGGGGKGMRIAHDESELLEGLARARSEAAASFGDDRVFLERFVTQPRHIEIQVLGDRFGHVIHLGERECSIQRRHQKVIEEAPSPFLDAATRRAMGEQAVRLAKAVGYHSAGTVEFIVDAERRFYFLEMNTRLQVEHPVTELVTGLDLVEQMIRIAAGQPLALRQEDVRLLGWAIEARVYAEDPGRGFLPSTGRLRRCQEPRGEGIRVDAGVAEGHEVSMFNDPMIAKLCAAGATRAEAAARLADALDAFVIRGPTHNIPFLAAIMRHERFLAGDLTTGFIAETFGERFEPGPPPAQDREDLATAALALWLVDRERGANGAQVGSWVVRLGEAELALDATRLGPRAMRIGTAGAAPREVTVDWRPGLALARLELDGRALAVQVDPCREGYDLTTRGRTLRAIIRSSRAAELARRIPERPKADLSRFVLSPMPGLIVQVAVEPGQTVKQGQELCILEAMKMENVLRAERDGTIAEVKVAARDTVSSDQVLVVFA
jgi:propionyl-CoA carboxylase alpha chain